MSKTHDVNILKTVDKEVFNSNASKTMTENFTKQFSVSGEDIEQMFQQPGQALRTSIKKMQDKQKEEESKQLDVDDDDMAAFANIRRESDKRFQIMQQDHDNENEFNERASIMSMGGRERRTALGRGTVSAGSGSESTNPGSSDQNDPAVIRHNFMEAVTSRSSTIQQLKQIYMNPLPEEIGPIQCNIRRDQSGVNKFSPKYFLSIADSNTPMLSATKIQSITCHM